MAIVQNFLTSFLPAHSFKHIHLLNSLGRASIDEGQTLKTYCILKHSLMYSSGSKNV